jgi:hypothetical protein
MFINKMMMESWQKITMVALYAGARHLLQDEDGNLKMTKRKTSGFHFANAGLQMS